MQECVGFLKEGLYNVEKKGADHMTTGDVVGSEAKSGWRHSSEYRASTHSNETQPESCRRRLVRHEVFLVQ